MNSIPTKNLLYDHNKDLFLLSVQRSKAHFNGRNVRRRNIIDLNLALFK